MGGTVGIILGLLVAWFLGYEVGKYAMMEKIKKTIRDATNGIEQLTKVMKEQKEQKSNESTESIENR